MMDNQKNEKENINVRALLFAKREVKEFVKERNVLGFNIEVRKTFSHLKATYGIAQLKSKREPISTLLRERVKKKGSKYIYGVYISDIMVRDDWSVLIAAPMRELLIDVRQKNEVIYCRCDLHAILNDQFIGPRETRVNITRLNARIFGDSRAKSIVLYGKGLTTAGVLKDILGKELIKREDGPFPKVNTGESRLEPSSCRLVWDDGKTAKPFALNIDIFGNYSFFLREMNEIQSLINILSYINDLDAIKADVEIDPLKRSSTALERISK